jgi:hypothetical protein
MRGCGVAAPRTRADNALPTLGREIAVSVTVTKLNVDLVESHHAISSGSRQYRLVSRRSRKKQAAQ